MMAPLYLSFGWYFLALNVLRILCCHMLITSIRHSNLVPVHFVSAKFIPPDISSLNFNNISWLD